MIESTFSNKLNIKKYYYHISKFVIILFIGIMMPYFIGIQSDHYDLYRWILLVSTCVFFIAAIWYLTGWLLSLINKNQKWFLRNYIQVIFSILLVSILVSGGCMILILSIIKKENHQNDNYISPWIILFIFLVISLFATIFEFLKKEFEYNNSKVQELNIAKLQAELEALKNQVEPHFIFNSLNALSYLILEDPANAVLYNDNLGQVYHYILQNKNNDMVTLSEEMEFISNYFFLIKIRFADAVDLRIHLHHMITKNYFLPPISLQILIENAVKHNSFSTDEPLLIQIFTEAGFVNVKNEKRVKHFENLSTGIGLFNLNNRFQLLTNKSILIENGSKEFLVRLPLTKEHK